MLALVKRNAQGGRPKHSQAGMVYIKLRRRSKCRCDSLSSKRRSAPLLLFEREKSKERADPYFKDELDRGEHLRFDPSTAAQHAPRRARNGHPCVGIGWRWMAI
jgi:hypothetical protein